MVLGNCCSNPWPLKYARVQQSSGFSPLYLTSTLRPLGEVIRGMGLRYHQYVDDTQCYRRLPSDPKVEVKILAMAGDGWGIG